MNQDTFPPTSSSDAPAPHEASPSAAALAALDAARCHLDSAHDAVMALETQKEAAGQECSGLAARYEELQTEADQLRVQLDKHRVEAENLAHQNAVLQEEKRGADEENARLNHSLGELSRAVEDRERESDELKRTLADKQEENDNLFAQVLDLHDLQTDDLPTLIIEMSRQLTGAEVGLFTEADGDDVIASLGMDDLQPSIANALFEFTRRVRAENSPLVENNSDKLPDGAGLVNLSALPVATKGQESGILLLANKRSGAFSETDTKMLLAIGQHAGIALENARLHRQLNEAYTSTIAVLADAIEAKDAYTRGHCESVMRLAVEVGQRLELQGDRLDEVRYSALLHDIGKIGVPDGILLKPGKLMDEEFLIIQKHPAIGRDLVARVPTLARLTDAILHHHEKWDGSGYPDGLAGEGIPLAARIVGAVDAFDAMTTPRPYRNPVSHGEAVAEMKRCSGTQFDPRVVELIDQILHEGMKIHAESHQTERSILASALSEAQSEQMSQDAGEDA